MAEVRKYDDRRGDTQCYRWPDNRLTERFEARLKLMERGDDEAMYLDRDFLHQSRIPGSSLPACRRGWAEQPFGQS